MAGRRRCSLGLGVLVLGAICLSHLGPSFIGATPPAQAKHQEVSSHVPMAAEYAEPAESMALSDAWLASLPSWTWRGVILLLCVLWATNFAVIKDITAQPGVTTQMYAVSRFSVAAAALSPWISSISSQKVLLRAVECGSWVAFGYIGQAIGLMTTTASKSCFICSLNVVFVAMIIGVTKRKFDPQTLAAAVLAVAGVGFLELAGSQQFVIGDLISLAQPIGFGMGYIRLEEIMAENPKDALPVTAVKLSMAALASWAYFAATSGAVDLEPVFSNNLAVAGVLYTGLVTTALALLVESVAFRFVDAASASVIFTTEPLWAAIFAVWLINEPFSSVDAVGGALVISANIIKEMPKEYLPWSDSDSK
ncbi:unnamed protein product [Effrenium voratum]|uniref:EamA domain-containing protein n=1 Tax=Effrenium voratum TaxID=2562239 RepID=A0AA36HNG9_9DINO|nr:unnamed protein product [Effrenium voratum]CAJ1418272.1 unnamed protein product [Effrenium voratum]|eukprot:CAMPEP_0181412030 /NCGR_PEP_ID=MMETSP1110-20121109/8207_1 /TAXON_ID=174948 /ORGANISM="Symbiodinium sp., Strain CCMP421" /LENGTH=364 /DNA_ID=CAMNT_0023534721 /DNA_START=33 /DNA_END=1127 /DNA_ORIENTATION=+